MDKGDVLFEAFVFAMGDTAKDPAIAKLIAENRKERDKLRAAQRALANTKN